MSDAKSYRRIEAVKLTVSILRHMAGQTGPVSGQDMAVALGIPHATVMCHLTTLADEGLVRFIGGHAEFDMGMALFWARYKSRTESQMDRLSQELKQIAITN